MKTSRKFATSPDILVAKGKHSVANATVLVAISSPAIVNPDTFRIRVAGQIRFKYATCGWKYF